MVLPHYAFMLSHTVGKMFCYCCFGCLGLVFIGDCKVRLHVQGFFGWLGDEKRGRWSWQSERKRRVKKVCLREWWKCHRNTNDSLTLDMGWWWFIKKEQNSPQVSWPGIEPRTDRLTRHSTVCRSTNWAIKRGISIYPRWGSNPRPWVY